MQRGRAGSCHCLVFHLCFCFMLQYLPPAAHVAFSFLLTLIYSFSPEMGFINHCNAALGKMVLSAGRNTSPLTAPAGRKTPALLPGSGDRLLMVFAFYVCARAIGAGPEGAFRAAPPSYFKSPPAAENKLLLPASQGGREGKAAQAGRKRQRALLWIPPRHQRPLKHLFPFPKPGCAFGLDIINLAFRPGPTLPGTVRSLTGPSRLSGSPTPAPLSCFMVPFSL